VHKFSVLALGTLFLVACGGGAPAAQSVPPASKPAASVQAATPATAPPASGSSSAVVGSPKPAGASVKPAASGADPVAVFRRAIDARNRADVTGFLAEFTDDAIRVDRPCGPQGCVGKEAIRRTAEEDVKGHINVTVLSAGNAGGTVLSRTEIRNDGVKAQGLDRIISIYAVEVRGGNIVSWRSVSDLSDPQSATFASAAASSESSASPKP
jgi:hypothetical protein